MPNPFDVPRDPDYIVLRAYPAAPPGWMPADLEGRWYDRATVGSALDEKSTAEFPAVAVPTGRFEAREENGAVAEVWEVRPAGLVSA